LQDLTPKVLITGDVMADALQFAVSKASAHSDILARLELQPQGYLLATVHRPENTDDPDRLGNIMTAFSELAEREPVILPLHPRTKKILEDHSPSLLTPNSSRLTLLDPVGYFDIIALEKSARLLLTDSGGMQKEAYWLKVPCITLRDETEWIETVELGWNILTGADRDRIIKMVRTFKAPSEHPPLYGDGNAAAHCLKALLTTP
jgi:UDP-N-acetylglucosamine 2-epimerase